MTQSGHSFDLDQEEPWGVRFLYSQRSLLHNLVDDPRSEFQLMLTASRLHQVLAYNPKTGIFRWKRAGPGPVRPGDVAGTLHRSMYRSIRVDGRLYQSSRLAWLYTKGRWPKNLIHCVNGDPSDVRWANLQEITHSQRRSLYPAQGKLGVKGVCVRRGRYIAEIKARGQKRYLGTFNTLEEASAAYAKAAEKAFGSCARTQ
jgi:hypothetical protein